MVVISRNRWRISLTTAFILAALILSLVATIATRVASHATGGEQLTQISSDPYKNPDSNHKTEVEPDTFTFGNTIVATMQVGRIFDGGAANIGFATSTNGGETWVHGFLPDTTVNATPPNPKYPRASDASVAFDARHNAWIISYLGLFPNGNGAEVDVLSSRSTDGGLTWGNPVVVNASGDFNDKNWTVCDDTSSSPFYGNCYTEFDDAGKLNLFSMSTSTDGGLTWGAPTTDPNHTCVIGGQPLVQPNGTVIVPEDDCLESVLLSFRSTDGGKTWSKRVLAAQLLNDGHPGAIRAPTLPSAEMDKSGRVYITWSDCRFENFCNTGNNDLVLSSSADGIHWTTPKRIPTNPVGCTVTRCVDNLLPGLAVDRSTNDGSAHLGLVYYYFPSIFESSTAFCSPSTCKLNVGFLSSTNGGATWSSAERLAGPMTLTWAPLTTQGFMVGDYFSTSIVAGDDDATPVFMVAKAPSPPPDCSNLSTGAPGQGCNQATYTTPEDLLQLIGGTNPATGGATVNVVAKQHLTVRQTAF